MAMIMPSAHEISPVLEELNHDGPTLAIGSEAILSRDDRERATESAFHLARDRRNARASVQASRRHGFRGSELVAEAGADDLHVVARPGECDGKEASGRDRSAQSDVAVEALVEVFEPEHGVRIDHPSNHVSLPNPGRCVWPFRRPALRAAPGGNAT